MNTKPSENTYSFRGIPDLYRIIRETGPNTKAIILTNEYSDAADGKTYTDVLALVNQNNLIAPPPLQVHPCVALADDPSITTCHNGRVWSTVMERSTKLPVGWIAVIHCGWVHNEAGIQNREAVIQYVKDWLAADKKKRRELAPKTKVETFC